MDYACSSHARSAIFQGVNVVNVWYGTAGNELTSILRSMAQPVGKKAGVKQVDLVEGKDFQEKETEKDSNAPVAHLDRAQNF